MKRWIFSTICMMGIGSFGVVHAEELVGTPAATPVAITTAPVTVVPVATSSSPVVVPVAVATPAVNVPVVVATGPVIQPNPQVAVPVVIPVATSRRHDLVAWKKLDGTVQSVDRANESLVVQDREGKNVQVVYNDQIRIYRNGERIPYADVSPNDRVVLRYEP